MNNSLPKIVGANGDYNTVTQNIHLQPGQTAPYMLPQDIGDFTGRVNYIAQIEEILERGKVAAISGMSGVGKSALAIRVANRLKEQYPDAQLYVNLYGQTPELVMEPRKVLIRFLQALTGQDESQLATDLDGLVAQYRSTLATKRALVILDNARDEAQIRDLLLSNPNCAVVVTSRSRLTGLPGAGSIDLEPMAVGIDRELGEAELLFQSILQDSQRVDSQLSAAREIVQICGGLPIAIRITAATLNQKIWARKPLSAYAQELATESTRLSHLNNENVEQAVPGQGSVLASFNLSYQGLTTAEQQVFRWAGGLPGVNFSLGVLAAVMEQEESQIETRLGRLIEAQVLESLGDNRFGWHDLMRLFAKAQLTESERETVSDRGLTWYCGQAIYWHYGLAPVPRQRLAQQCKVLTGNAAEEWGRVSLITALNWFAAEQDNWVDVVRYLTQVPRLDDAIDLTANLAPFFGLRGGWGDWVTTHEMVKECAHQAGNLPGVAQTLNNLVMIYEKQSKWDEAITCGEESLEIFRQLGDDHVVAQVLVNLGNVYQSHNKRDQAIACGEESLEIFRRLEDDYGIAQTLNNLGIVYKNQGKCDEAISCYEQALETKRQLGDDYGIAQTLDNLGIVYKNQGKCDEAISCYEQALETKRQLGNDYGIAQTLDNLGNVYKSQGKWNEAISCYEQSLKTKRQLGDNHGVGKTLANLGVLYNERNQSEQARTSWQEALKFLHPSSQEFQTVQKWLATPPKPRWINYLLPLAMTGLILFCLVKR